jgi:hypothetical protein
VSSKEEFGSTPAPSDAGLPEQARARNKVADDRGRRFNPVHQKAMIQWRRAQVSAK